MQCPKCASPMDKVGFQGVFFDRCEGCHGIWFDGVAHKALKKIHGSEAIDIGTEMEGHSMDAVRNVVCPVCGKAMDSLRDKFQPHIRYEACPAQDGVFFDAGEFRDFKQDTLGDFFKSLAWYFR